MRRTVRASHDDALDANLPCCSFKHAPRALHRRLQVLLLKAVRVELDRRCGVHHRVDTSHRGGVVTRFERAGDDELELPGRDVWGEDGRVERCQLRRGPEGAADGPSVEEEGVGDVGGELG